MPSLKLIKNAFNTGEISPFAMGRTDFQGQSGNKYDHACESLQNFIPLIQGGVTKRPGTRFVCPAQSTGSRLIPFRNFLGNGGYVIELGNLTARFYHNGGFVADASTTTTSDVTLPTGTIPVVSTAGFPASGKIVVNGQFVLYTGVTANSFTGCTLGVGVISSGSSVGHQYQITTPWASADLEGIKFAQVEDVMYLVHPSYAVQKLSFVSSADWTIEAPNFIPPPTHEFDRDYSGGTINLTLGVTTAGSTGNFTTSAPFWLAGDVGRFVVVGSGIAYVTQVTSSTIAVVNVVDSFASGSAAAGTWFIRGAPSGILCLGFIDGSNNFHATTTFGPSTQACYSFATYPINLDSTASIGFLDCFRPQDIGNYLVIGGATAFIGNVVDAHSITVQILNSVIQTTVPFTNPTTGASAIIMQAQSGGTWTIEVPSFGGGHGNPGAVCFFQDRLMLASTTDQPQTVWGSQTGDYENFSKGTLDSDALDEEINSGFREPIYWLAAYQGQIAAGTPESEYIISSGAGSGGVGGGLGAAITPTNFSAAIQSRYGVANIQPLFIESHLLYIQRAMQTVYEFAYDIYQGIFGSKNLNILHDLVTTSGWKEVAYAHMPYRLVCFIDNSGNLCTLTYNREQDVWAWARHYTGQDSASGDGFESVASILSPNGLNDQIWFVTSRTINGVTGGYIEVLDPGDGIVAGDMATVGTFNPAKGTITGLGYLLGRTVWVNAVTSGGGAAAVFGPYTITSTGQIQLPVGITVTSVQVALPACSQLVTVRPEIQGGGQTIQGLLKNWNRIWARLYNTINVKINGSRVAFRQPSMPMGQGVPAPVNTNPDVTAAEGAQPDSNIYNPIVLNPAPAYTFATFDERIENLGYDRDGRIVIQQDLPLPATVLALFGQMGVGDR